MLKELKHHHREIARLTQQGFKQQEIASQLGTRTATVRSIQKDPLFQNHMASLEDRSDEETLTARKILADGAVKAAKKVVETIESYDEKLALQASKDVLDRTGYSAAQQSQHLHAHVHLSAEEIRDLKNRARSAGVLIGEDEAPEQERDLTQ